MACSLQSFLQNFCPPGFWPGWTSTRIVPVGRRLFLVSMSSTHPARFSFRTSVRFPTFCALWDSGFYSGSGFPRTSAFLLGAWDRFSPMCRGLLPWVLSDLPWRSVCFGFLGDFFLSLLTQFVLAFILIASVRRSCLFSPLLGLPLAGLPRHSSSGHRTFEPHPEVLEFDSRGSPVFTAVPRCTCHFLYSNATWE